MKVFVGPDVHADEMGAVIHGRLCALTTKRVRLNEEWYPVIQLFGPEDWGPGFDDDAEDLPADLVERYDRAFAEFVAVQKELAEHFGEGGPMWA